MMFISMNGKTKSLWHNVECRMAIIFTVRSTFICHYLILNCIGCVSGGYAHWGSEREKTFNIFHTPPNFMLFYFSMKNRFIFTIILFRTIKRNITAFRVFGFGDILTEYVIAA